jgi:hypothetical protein
MKKARKFDQFLTEMDSTLWPVPGQDMSNKAVTYKSLPSLEALLKATPDTDPMHIISSAPMFGAPLQHSMDHYAEVFQSLQSLKNLLVTAKNTPVYQGRKSQQDTLDELLERIERMQKFLYHTAERMDNLSLESLK